MNTFNFKTTIEQYELIKDNVKKFDLRFFNDYVNKIKVGDIIQYYTIDISKNIKREVESLMLYESFFDILNDYNINDIFPNYTNEEAVKEFNKIIDEKNISNPTVVLIGLKDCF